MDTAHLPGKLLYGRYCTSIDKTKEVREVESGGKRK